jgi:hydroxyethylthiazole kinase
MGRDLMTENSWRAVRAQVCATAPLIHNITNHVVMNVTANALLAFGASPAMVHASEEVAAFVQLSRALVINIGTLDAGFVTGMELAAAAADRHGVPWVLDPVGVGATAYRAEICQGLLLSKPAVIRANAGEILALAGHTGASRGVDSLAGSDEALAAAKALSRRTGAVVALTGATDYAVLDDAATAVTGGHPLSQRMTGSGCVTTALVGACLAVADPLEAAVAALGAMKAAAETAATRASGPGSFAAALIDALAE